MDSARAVAPRPIALVGAEIEENLSLRYLAAALSQAGFESEIVPFVSSDDVPRAAAQIVALDPLAIGLSIPFQHYAREALALAERLRALGNCGHISCGGHFATFEWESILRRHRAIDSVVRHEGERTFVELCGMLRDGEPPHLVPGLILRDGDEIRVAEPRALPPLDELPFPDRRGSPATSMDVATTVMSGSRGCYGDCSFCCINAWGKNALGPAYRARSVESIATEMEQEYRRRGVRIFIFHDDTFFVPRREKNLERCRALRDALHARGMGDVGLVLKARPNDVDPEVFSLLKSIGLLRAYVGIESNSNEGLVSLNRRISAEDNRRALTLLRELDVHASFNVLIFDPEATLEGIERNLAFMEEFGDFPSNFCRAEVYAGTPLKRILEAQGRLVGDYLGWNYQMRDPRVELLFRVATTAFAPRNFKADGIAALNMGLRYDLEIIRRFHPRAWSPGVHATVTRISQDVARSSAEGMRTALAFVRGVDLGSEPTKRFTIELARRLASDDLALLRRISSVRTDLERRMPQHP